MGNSGGNSNSGCGVVFLVLFVLGVLMSIPKEVWIVVGIIVAVALGIWAVVAGMKALERRSQEAAERERNEKRERAAAAKRAREAQARVEKQRRIDSFGKSNAARVETALESVERVAASEAARAGWLGDIDFSADIRSITAGYQKAHALRKFADELSVLDNPNDDDRRLLAEANSTVNDLEGRATERVELIGKCATEARLIDESLRKEREDARTAEQRAELHGKLSALLYGVEAAPDASAVDSGVDRVMARVAAYREIKKQIVAARD
ncbi:MAG: hypothetical protein KDB70_05600 [Mycobacterium sp.]|nr:hypothetical protein [Mycobacterium sp.]